jgi:hypothetical protein
VKLVLEEREIQSNFDGQESFFSIDATQPFIFDLLRRHLYSDPHTSVVRELLSNAIDSHVAAGRSDVPVQIILNNNQIIFNDFGTGMSPHTVREVYAVYGKSTKRESDDQIGAWGVGAKSFFGISSVDSAIIETIHNGTKYTYCVYIDETNLGKIKTISEEPTDQHNGTSIKVPIAPSDKILLQNAINFYYDWIFLPIDLPGGLKRDRPRPLIKGDQWAVFSHPKCNECNVIANGIPYKADPMYNIPDGVIIYLNGSTFDLTASREDLRKTPRTESAIKNALENYSREIVSALQSQIDQVESFAEVLNLVRSLPQNSQTKFPQWTHRGKTFTYPLEKPILFFERRYDRTSSHKTKTFGSKVTENQFVIDDKNSGAYFISPYDKQKITHKIKTESLDGVYLIPPDFLPIKAPKLSELRITRGSSGPRGPRQKRTHIWGKDSSGMRSMFAIDPPKEIIYHVKGKDIVPNAYRIYNIVEIKDKDEKHILKNPKWISIENYIEKKLYKSFTREEIERAAQATKYKNTFNHLEFLRDEPEFNFLRKDFLDKRFDDNILRIVELEVGRGKIEVQPPPIYDKYPMLKVLSYSASHDKTHQQIIKKYIQDVKNHSYY